MMQILEILQNALFERIHGHTKGSFYFREGNRMVNDFLLFNNTKIANTWTTKHKIFLRTFQKNFCAKFSTLNNFIWVSGQSNL